MILALVATGLPVFAHTAGMGTGVVFAVMLGTLAAVFAPSALPVILVTAFAFQNTFVAMITPVLDGDDAFRYARMYNFVLLVTMWMAIVVPVLVARDGAERSTPVMRWSIWALVITGLYFLFGLASHGSSAVMYLRNVAMPILCLQLAFVVAFRHRVDLRPLAAIGVFVLLYGYSELFFQLDFLRLFNGDEYVRRQAEGLWLSGYWVREMQETGFVLRDLNEAMTGTLFNYFSTLDIRIYRLTGPNFHAVSFAYLVGFGIIFSICVWRRYLPALIALPIFVTAGSKGALAYVVLVVGAVIAARWLRKSWVFPVFCAFVVVYGAFMLGVAIAQQNYHALGFMAGVDKFLSNPIGHGLGAGGNLATRFESIDWSRAQQLGRTDEVVESAVGVLIYQMGIGALALFAMLCVLARSCWSAYKATGHPMLSVAAFALPVLLANGVLQEEALFAPLALAVMLLVAGLGLGAVHDVVRPGERLRR